MWVYIRPEPGLYAVGFYKPDGTWVPESDHADKSEARDHVNYLNGGSTAALGEISDQLYRIAQQIDRN